MKRFPSFTVFLHCLLVSVLGERVIILHSATAQGNDSYVSGINTTVINNALYAKAYVHGRLSAKLLLNVSAQIRFQGAADYQHLLTYKVNICHSFTRTLIGPLMYVWLQLFRQHTNFMFSCPIEQGTYQVTNLTLPARALPVYLPAGDYRLKAEVMRYQQHVNIFIMHLIFDLSIYGNTIY